MMSVTETKDYGLAAMLNEEIQTLHVQLHPWRFKPYDRVAMELAFKEFFARPGHWCFIAWQGSTPVGYVLLVERNSAENAFVYAGTVLYIDQICVLTAYRNSGAGSLLMQRAETLAAALGINQLVLDHWSANTIAATYFRKQGYTLQREQMVKIIG